MVEDVDAVAVEDERDVVAWLCAFSFPRFASVRKNPISFLTGSKTRGVAADVGGINADEDPFMSCGEA